MVGSVNSYRELIVWQKAMDFAEGVYRVTEHFPKGEQFGLVSQLRRAAVSIPSNIAEGLGRDTVRDYSHFLVLAKGSLNEVMTQLELAVRLGYLKSGSGLYEVSCEIGKMLNAMIRRLRSRTDDNDKKEDF